MSKNRIVGSSCNEYALVVPIPNILCSSTTATEGPALYSSMCPKDGTLGPVDETQGVTDLPSQLFVQIVALLKPSSSWRCGSYHKFWWLESLVVSSQRSCPIEKSVTFCYARVVNRLRFRTIAETSGRAFALKQPLVKNYDLLAKPLHCAGQNKKIIDCREFT